MDARFLGRFTALDSSQPCNTAFATANRPLARRLTHSLCRPPEAERIVGALARDEVRKAEGDRARPDVDCDSAP